MKQIFDWYGFPIIEYDDTCARCGGEDADVEENGVFFHQECLDSFHESPEYEKAWKEYLDA